MIKLAISGCQGKMGQSIIKFAASDKDFKIAALLERKGHPDIGKEINNIKIADNFDVIRESDVLIEFTTPEATLENLKFCLKHKKPIVIGTTGLTSQQQDEIKNASKNIAVVFSPNMSIGVNLLFNLVREAASKLPFDYKINITEAHHVHKKDTPSGTAKKLAEVIKDSRREEVKNIKSIREDEIVGDHEVVFDSQFDTIKLSHSAKTRDIFAQGALCAAKWVVGKKKGLFSMQDVL